MAHYKGAASEAGRAMQLLKKRELAQMEIEYRKKKIEEDLKISNIENKFAAHYDAVEQQLKTSTIGLVTLDEMKAKQENAVKERERELAQSRAENEREQQRQLEAKQAERNRQKRQTKCVPDSHSEEHEMVGKRNKKPLRNTKSIVMKSNVQVFDKVVNEQNKQTSISISAFSNNSKNIFINPSKNLKKKNPDVKFKMEPYCDDGKPTTKYRKQLYYDNDTIVTKSEEDYDSEEETHTDDNEELMDKDMNKRMLPFIKGLKSIRNKRQNKNRPQELSSKAPVKSKIPKPVPGIDPRFDSLYGSYNESSFNLDYSFLKDVKAKEIKLLQKKQRKTKSKVVKAQIAYLLERMTNQQLAQEKNIALKDCEKEQKKKFIKDAFENGSASFLRRKEQSMLGMLRDYEELVKQGKLRKYFHKKNKEKEFKVKRLQKI